MLIKLQMSLMLSFTFVLFIEILSPILRQELIYKVDYGKELHSSRFQS
jgi:hypothetical protein